MARLSPQLNIAALLAGVALLGAGLDSAPASAQNAAMQRAEMLNGARQATGKISQVDHLGRIVVVDGVTYLLGRNISPGGLNVGQAVEVTFEPSNAGALRRAVRIAPR